MYELLSRLTVSQISLCYSFRNCSENVLHNFYKHSYNIAAMFIFATLNHVKVPFYIFVL